jgi:hypothetical protein
MDVEGDIIDAKKRKLETRGKEYRRHRYGVDVTKRPDRYPQIKICNRLRMHAEELKDDKERLPTEYILSLVFKNKKNVVGRFN